MFHTRLKITLGAEDISVMPNTVIIAFGANVAGAYGSPRATLNYAFHRLVEAGLRPNKVSGLFETKPIGSGIQDQYMNAVASFQCAIPLAMLLKLLKEMERDAGRIRRKRNSSRPLDLDIIDFQGSSLGWQRPARRMAAPGRPSSRVRRRSVAFVHRPHLQVPHPEMHRRRFVLEPLLEIARAWRHRALDAPGRTLLAHLPKRPHEICRVLDSTWCS